MKGKYLVRVEGPIARRAGGAAGGTGHTEPILQQRQLGRPITTRERGRGRGQKERRTQRDKGERERERREKGRGENEE